MSKLPTGWDDVSFMEIFDIQGGTQPPKKEFIYHPKNGYIRLLQIRDFGDKPLATYIPFSKNLKKCNKDDILIGRYGASVGRICTGMEGAYNVALAKVIISSIFCKKFIYFLLKSDLFQKPILSTERSAQDGFNKEDLSQIIVSIPPANEQRRIVAKLEKLLAKVDTCKERLDKIPGILKRFRQSVLSTACSGRLTADWRENNPDVEPAEELLKRVAKKSKQSFEENVFKFIENNTVIPDTWQWTKLNLIIEKIQSGKNFSCPEIPVTEDTVGIVKISAVTWDKFDYQETKTVLDSSKINPNLFIKDGDFLISRANTIELVGSSVVVEEINYRIMISDKVWRLNFLDVSKKYVNFYLKSRFGRKEIESRATGNQNSMRNISQGAFRGIVIAIPPLEEQQEIVRRVENLLKTADQIEQRYQKARTYIDQLTQSILAKAFRGELVPQDPNDEPASVLLERIRAERENRENVAKTAKKPAANKKQRSKKAQPQLEPKPQLEPTPPLEPIQLELPLFE